LWGKPNGEEPIADLRSWGGRRGGTPRMDAIKQVARRRGLSKREVYDQLLAAKE
jgi:hypothetical protein